MSESSVISMTRLQRELAKQLRRVSETGEPLYVLRRGHVANVIVSLDEYAALKEIKEVFEYVDIYEELRERKKRYDPSQNVSLEEIRRQHRRRCSVRK